MRLRHKEAVLDDIDITLSLQPSGLTGDTGHFTAENPVVDGQEDSKLVPEEATYSADSRHTEV